MNDIKSSVYAQKVELLLRLIPIVMEEEVFAIHGGTAINLFLKDLPRYSVDIDLTYIPLADRQTSLDDINMHLKAIAEKAKKAFAGCELEGKKLGVIGLGAIGILVANAAKSLGMEVYGYDPYLSVDAAWNLSRSIHHAKTLDEIYENCDYITIHVPLTDETKNLVCADTLKKMKDGVRILNFARGGLVNNADLIEAIGTGKVAAYVVDFPSDDIIGVNGVIAIPHLGASTPESEDNCARMAADEVKAYLERGEIKNSVNMPAVELGAVNGTRICVIHRNVPTMISQITGAITAENVNIDNMVNKSRKAYAYTAIDTDGDVTDAVIAAISAVDGVLRVRVIK